MAKHDRLAVKICQPHHMSRSIHNNNNKLSAREWAREREEETKMTTEWENEQVRVAEKTYMLPRIKNPSSAIYSYKRKKTRLIGSVCQQKRWVEDPKCNTNTNKTPLLLFLSLNALVLDWERAENKFFFRKINQPACSLLFLSPYSPSLFFHYLSVDYFWCFSRCIFV